MPKKQHLVPPDAAVRLFVRAAALGYTASVLPGLLKILLLQATLCRRGKGIRAGAIARQLLDEAREGLSGRGWGVAAGIAFGGSKWGEQILEPWIRNAFRSWRTERREGEDSEVDDHRIRTLSTLLSSTLASFLAISLLHSSPQFLRSQVIESQSLHLPQLPNTSTLTPLPDPPIAVSPTLDLTLFIFVRATDILVRRASELIHARNLKGRSERVAHFLASYADTLVFAISTWRIMWCCACVLALLLMIYQMANSSHDSYQGSTSRRDYLLHIIDGS